MQENIFMKLSQLEENLYHMMIKYYNTITGND